MKKFLPFVSALILLCGSSVYAEGIFTDVPESDWAAPYIYNMSARGIVGGYGDGTFKPWDNVQRCEYAKMLVNIAGIEPFSGATSPYSDVPVWEWYFPYVNASLSLITGYTSNGTLYFNPEEAATREDVTVAMIKALGVDTSLYTDPTGFLAARFLDWESISAHNRAYIAAAVDKGIITGDMNGTFRPDDPIVRAEVVAVLYRAFPDGSGVEPNTVSLNEQTAVNSKLTAFFLDVGQGDSCFIELPDGSTMLIDAGTSSSGEDISDFIKERGHSQIDYVVATHPHADHIGGMSRIFEDFDVKNMYMPRASANSKTYTRTMEAIADEGCTLTYVTAGTEIGSIPQVSAEFTAPNGSEYSNLNNYSAVLRIDYKDASYLFGGDAEELAEGEILSFGRNVDADVLKVGHHGSQTSSSMPFLQAVSPNVAVISCGAGNSYGHPAQQTLLRLTAVGAAVYRTDTDGMITIPTDGSDITPSNVITAGK